MAMSRRPRSEPRVTCAGCAAYDADGRRCRVGKSNPRRKLESIAVAELLGPRALCLHNPWREPLILRMRYPWWVAPRARPLRPPAAVEVEVLEDDAAA